MVDPNLENRFGFIDAFINIDSQTFYTFLRENILYLKQFILTKISYSQMNRLFGLSNINSRVYKNLVMQLNNNLTSFIILSNL